jgi:anti-anti-sigma regulatory factor/anti-sigma regulatory factor (Ser/Thr protein kinase)
MEIEHSIKDGCLVIALSGSVDLFSAPQIQRALLKDLGEEPYALICDLSGVQELDPVCATVFATVANHPSSRWPATSFLLCSAQPPVAEILGLLTVPHFLQLYASLEDALDAAVARPPYLRDELMLAPIPTAAAAARTFVREVLRYWQLALPDTTLVDRAVLLVSELVTNAVRHAGSRRIELRLVRGDTLLCEVDDDDHDLPTLLNAGPGDESGRGLRVVSTLAREWGTSRTKAGKTVWFELTLPRR